MTEGIDVSLKEYLTSLIDSAEKRSDQRFESMKDMVQEAFQQSRLAIDKAEAATEKRLEGMNEFRDALRDQASSFVTRETLDALVSKLESEIEQGRKELDTLAARIDLREGQVQGSRLTWGNMSALLAGFAMLIGVLVVLANWISGQ